MEDYKSQVNNIRLPIGKVLVQAFLVPWALRHELVRALTVPAIALIMIQISESYLGDPGDAVLFAFAFIASVPYVLFAVTCHRIVLLGDQSVSRYGVIKWSMRETRFYFWGLGMYIVVGFAVFAIGFSIFTVGMLSIPIFDGIRELGLPIVQLLFLLMIKLLKI